MNNQFWGSFGLFSLAQSIVWPELEQSLVLYMTEWPMSLPLGCCGCSCLLYSLSNLFICCFEILLCLPSLTLCMNCLHSLKTA